MYRNKSFYNILLILEKNHKLLNLIENIIKKPVCIGIYYCLIKIMMVVGWRDIHRLLPHGNIFIEKWKNEMMTKLVLFSFAVYD